MGILYGFDGDCLWNEYIEFLRMASDWTDLLLSWKSLQTVGQLGKKVSKNTMFVALRNAKSPGSEVCSFSNSGMTLLSRRVTTLPWSIK